MGSVPSCAGEAASLPVLTPLTPDSSAFLQQVRSLKCHSSVAELRRAAEETRQEVSKALQSIHNNPFMGSRRLHSRSIHLVELDTRKRAATEAEERRDWQGWLVVREKEGVRCPPIRGRKEIRVRVARREKVGSVPALLLRK